MFKCCKYFFMMHNIFYIKLLNNTRYFVNSVICGWNLFLVLLINSSSSICLEEPKEKVDTIKFITSISKKIQYFNNMKKL